MYAFYIFHQEFNFFAIIPGQTIACSVGDIYNSSASFDNRFHNAGQVNIVGSSGIFAVKLNIFYVFLGVFYGSHSPFKNFILCGIEFMPDMKFGSSDACVDTFVLGVFERFGSYINVFLHAARQCTNGWPGDRF